MRLALLGDIHMYRLMVPPWDLLGKGLVGQLNVWLNRYWRFDRSLLAKVLQSVEAIRPDMLLLSGDVASITSAAEYRLLSEIMSPLIRRIPTVAVPGNHDRYTHMGTWQRRIERGLPGCVPEQFPFTRDLTESWKLLVLDTAVPRFLNARGWIGPAQLDRAAAIVRSLKPGQGLVILAHYDLGTPPPIKPPRRSHQLEDGPALLDLLRHCPGPVIYLHGHIHQPWCWRRPDPGLSHVLDIDAGAPIARSSRFPMGQGFWQIDLPPGPPGTARLDNVAVVHHVLAGEPAAPLK